MEYLRRIAAVNEAFQDSATIIGKFRHPDDAIGLVHAQDFVPRKKGSRKITDTQILRFLNEQGFELDPMRAGVL